MLLTVDKMKEVVVDFQRMRTATKPSVMMGEEVGVVEHCK